MNTTQVLLEADRGARQIVHARVTLLQEDGCVLVTHPSSTELVHCDVLQTAEGTALRLAVGDSVLLWLPEEEDARSVVLGRVGPSYGVAPQRELQEEIPETLLLEAKSRLTLRVGGGSITIREDGKILIEGKDLVSHAERVNRIKGGSVAIN